MGETDVIAALRRPRAHHDVLGGYGPGAIAVALFALMAVLLPSVAPEHIVERPAVATTTTTLAKAAP